MAFLIRVSRIGLLVALLTALTAGAALARNQVERPFTAREVGTVTIDPGCVDFFGDGCYLETESTGTTTHLGRTSTISEGVIKLFLEPCFLLDGVTEGIVFRSSGTATATAANGDTLSFVFENEGCTNPDPATDAIGTAIEGSQSVIGGIGRFADSSGSTTTFGHGFGSAFDLVATGSLTY